MHKEINVASNFIASYLPQEEQEEFISMLTSHLTRRITGHWYPSMPIRGSGYRSVKLLHKLDSVILSLGNFSLHALPTDCVVFIDPEHVSYRLGTGYLVPLYEGEHQPQKHISSPRSSSVTIKRPPLSPPRQDNTSRFPLEPINVA